jgi:predicted RNA-binding protein with PUA-like domain
LPPDKLSDRQNGVYFFAEKSDTIRGLKAKGVTRMLQMSDEIQFFCPECHAPFLMGLTSLESGAAHICASCGQRIEFVDESFEFEEEAPVDFPRPVLKEWRH